MEAAADERRLAKMQAHMAAARRLRAGMVRHPEARGGLVRCLRFHMARAATLADEISASADRLVTGQALAVISASAPGGELGGGHAATVAAVRSAGVGEHLCLRAGHRAHSSAAPRFASV